MRFFDKLFNRFGHSDDNSYSQKYSVTKKHSGLGSGGNGDVKKAICITTGEQVALKILNEEAKANKEKYLRFEDEVNTMVEAGKRINGIIPIVDYSIEGGWYVMPVAESIKGHCGCIEEIIDGIIQQAETLTELHKEGFSHRDIKPDNMLFYENRWVLCDFGLVDIPDNPHNLTKNNSRIGAVKTIAPEMSRNPKTADGTKADVYSLAKSLWMLLTDNKDSFEGHYDVTDKMTTLHQYNKLSNEHLVEIDELMEAATRNAPEDRPTMAQFVETLKQWKVVRADHRKQQISNWGFLKKYLFKGGGPQSCIWEDPVEIMHVLNVISTLPLYSHIFFPDKGWVQYKYVEISSEPSSLDIYTTLGIFRVRMGRLRYESFHMSYWNYFMLEPEAVGPVVGAEVDEYTERVVEDTPGHYVSAVDAMYGVYDYNTGEILPAGWKVVLRCLKGKLLIVLKQGPYNLISQTTDGRHNYCSSEEFRKYIEQMEQLYVLHGMISDEQWKKLYHGLVDGCPFKPVREMPDIEKLPNEDKDFVKNNWTNFDFNASIVPYAGMPIGRAKYRFIFHQSTGIDLFDWIVDKEECYLCKDGFIRKLHYSSPDIFEATDRECAIEICKNLEQRIDEYCEGKVWEIEQPYFTVGIEKMDLPKELFTKDEIKALMVAADDRKDNTLVIDENGHAHILNDVWEAKFYPVVNETWCERRKYVGKYSNLTDLDSSYHYCLGKWKDYLVTGEGQPRDDYDEYLGSEKELEGEIRVLMTTSLSH